jgi:polyhydroxyalkanoate synthesis repressor PhaR
MLQRTIATASDFVRVALHSVPAGAHMQPTGPRLVKKYGNRRLYDTSESRYITMEELADRVRMGADVRVVDAQNNEDLTQATLTQIIIEGRGAARFFSVPLLTQLIRMGDDALADFLGRYLTAALELYLQARSGAQAIAPYNPLAQMPFAAANALQRLFQYVPGWNMGQPPANPMNMQSAAPAQSPMYANEPMAMPPQPPIVPQQGTQDAAVEALRRELDALRNEVKGRGHARSGSRAAPKKKGAKKR